MKTLVARLRNKFATSLTEVVKAVRKDGLPAVWKSRNKRKLVGEEEILVAKGREQFQRLLDKGLTIPIATI